MPVSEVPIYCLRAAAPLFCFLFVLFLNRAGGVSSKTNSWVTDQTEGERLKRTKTEGGGWRGEMVSKLRRLGKKRIRDF